jgi:hypothetical protein
MKRREFIDRLKAVRMNRPLEVWIALFSLGVCLVLAACPSGPSSSAPDRESGESETALRERKADFVGGVLARRSLASRVFDDLTSALPDRVRLTEVTLVANTAQVRGTAPTNNVLADYLSRLGGGASLAGATLRGSSLRTSRGREYVEFLLEAAVREPANVSVPADKLDTALPPRQDDAAMLRELQMLALGEGLQMTRFAPGVASTGEFAADLPVAIEVAGDTAELAGFLEDLAGLERLWVVERFSFKAVSSDDPRAGVRASVAARAYFAR